MKKYLEKVAKTSENIENENLQKLRAVFPNFVKDGQVDFDALQKFFDKEGILSGEEKFGLNWAGKSNAFKAIRTPAIGTLVPQPEESKNWDSTENVFIEGDNLEVLKLLQKNYREKIKMIYIDPPYNTGKDFVYKDNFTQDVSDYYEQTGQTKGGIKMTANTEKNGRYHSDWLTMMYPRLFLGRNLLKDDGVIFVSIDDNEVANLRMIMDEIFGEENFVAQIVWHSKYTVANDTRYLSQQHEYVLCYAKNKENIDKLRLPRTQKMDDRYTNPDNDPRGPWKATPLHAKSGNGESYTYIFSNGVKWKAPQGRYPRYGLITLRRLDEENRLWFGKDLKTTPSVKTYLSELSTDGCVSGDVWHFDDVGHTHSSNEELADVLGKGMFDNPKPTRLVMKAIQLSCNENDLVLDFFGGSGTTAHAVMQLNAKKEGVENRKWICVQLPEVTDEDSEAYKAGYKTIAEISRERIRRAGDKIKKGDIGFKSYKLSTSNYRQWNVSGVQNEKEILKTSKLFLENPLVDKYDEKSVVYEILLKEGFDLNSKIEQQKSDLKSWIVIDGDKNLFVTFVENVTKEQVEKLGLSENDTFVCFDSSLDDTTKVNLGRYINVKVI
ncbi:MAG: site-specific DNA-methyltransferase [Candidatus Paceibacterota bacterium]